MGLSLLRIDVMSTDSISESTELLSAQRLFRLVRPKRTSADPVRTFCLETFSRAKKVDDADMYQVHVILEGPQKLKLGQSGSGCRPGKTLIKFKMLQTWGNERSAFAISQLS